MKDPIAAASPQSTFPRFNDLPKEIRIMIWRATIRPRVVNIRQRAVDFDKNLSTGLIRGQKIVDSTYSRANARLSGREAEVARERFPRPSAATWSLMNEVEMQLQIVNRSFGREEGVDDVWESKYGVHRHFGYQSTPSGPDALYACSESFESIVKYYPRCLRDYRRPSFPQTYLNMELDTVYIRYDTFWPSAQFTDPYNIEEMCTWLECIEEIGHVRNLAVLLDYNVFWEDVYHCIATGTGLQWLLKPRFEFLKRLKQITILFHDGHAAGNIVFLDTKTAKVFELRRFELESWKLECKLESLPEDHHWYGGVDEDILEYWRLEMVKITQEKAQERAQNNLRNTLRKWWIQIKQAIGILE